MDEAPKERETPPSPGGGAPAGTSAAAEGTEEVRDRDLPSENDKQEIKRPEEGQSDNDSNSDASSSSSSSAASSSSSSSPSSSNDGESKEEEDREPKETVPESPDAISPPKGSTELVEQVKGFKNLLKEQQQAWGEMVAKTPKGNNREEDDDLESELLNLSQSEDMLREELDGLEPPEASESDEVGAGVQLTAAQATTPVTKNEFPEVDSTPSATTGDSDKATAEVEDASPGTQPVVSPTQEDFESEKPPAQAENKAQTDTTQEATPNTGVPGDDDEFVEEEVGDDNAEFQDSFTEEIIVEEDDDDSYEDEIIEEDEEIIEEPMLETIAEESEHTDTTTEGDPSSPIAVIEGTPKASEEPAAADASTPPTVSPNASPRSKLRLMRFFLGGNDDENVSSTGDKAPESESTEKEPTDATTPVSEEKNDTDKPAGKSAVISTLANIADDDEWETEGPGIPFSDNLMDLEEIAAKPDTNMSDQPSSDSVLDEGGLKENDLGMHDAVQENPSDDNEGLICAVSTEEETMHDTLQEKLSDGSTHSDKENAVAESSKENTSDSTEEEPMHDALQEELSEAAPSPGGVNVDAGSAVPGQVAGEEESSKLPPETTDNLASGDSSAATPRLLRFFRGRPKGDSATGASSPDGETHISDEAEDADRGMGTLDKPHATSVISGRFSFLRGSKRGSEIEAASQQDAENIPPNQYTSEKVMVETKDIEAPPASNVDEGPASPRIFGIFRPRADPDVAEHTPREEMSEQNAPADVISDSSSPGVFQFFRGNNKRTAKHNESEITMPGHDLGNDIEENGTSRHEKEDTTSPDPPGAGAFVTARDDVRAKEAVGSSSENQAHPSSSALSTSPTRKRRMMMIGIASCLLLIVLIILLSVLLSRDRGNDDANDSVGTAPPNKCFESKEQLQKAINLYVLNNSSDTLTAQTYGYPIGSWCTSSVTDFSFLFAGFPGEPNPFNEDIGDWDTSSVTNFDQAFYWANEFNRDISGWNFSNAKSADSMFAFASSFNQPLDSWDTSNLENAESMFTW